ncbi:hypothetical protein L9F63_010789, partial [Diploptera punctata]
VLKILQNRNCITLMFNYNKLQVINMLGTRRQIEAGTYTPARRKHERRARRTIFGRVPERKVPPFSWVATGFGICCPTSSSSQSHRDVGDHTLLANSNRWSSRRRKTQRPRHPHIDAVARGAAVAAVVTIV